MRQGVVRLKANRRAVFDNAPIQVALVVERDAEVVVRQGVVRLKANRRAEFGDGLI